MLSFEIGQRERSFYNKRTDRESHSHPVPYYNIDMHVYLDGDMYIVVINELLKLIIELKKCIH